MPEKKIGYIESFNDNLKDKLFNRKIFSTLLKVKLLIEQWPRDYNEFRPHSAIGYRPPALLVVIQPTFTPATPT